MLIAESLQGYTRKDNIHNKKWSLYTVKNCHFIKSNAILLHQERNKILYLEKNYSSPTMNLQQRFCKLAPYAHRKWTPLNLALCVLNMSNLRSIVGYEIWTID